MMITTEMDSETPNSHPCNAMIATTLMITIATHKIEIVASTMFLVANSKIRKAKHAAIAIPCTAEVTKALSDAIQAQ